MIRYRTLPLALLALAWTAPAVAAVTAPKGIEENPRLAWRERYQESRQGPEQTERFSETYRVGGDAAVDLTHISGDVRVVTGRSNEVRIEAIKRVRHRSADEARRLLGLLRIDVTQVGGRLEVRTIYPRSNTRSLSASVDYTITVPQSAAVAVKTVSGDVSVTAVRGEVRAEAVSGDVDVTATPNLALAKTVSGDVRARDIASNSLTIGTISGTVIATALKVRTLDANSVSGDVQLSDLQVERLMAKTVSGEIEFAGTLARGGRYEFNAHSGDVRLMLAANTPGFELDASTFSGSIRSDFPVTLRSNSQAAGGRRGISNRSIRGTYGDASAIVAIRSFSGTVVITKK
jgi:DUF4097 and DUF4098 domain-containing protein YvlB